MKKHLILATGLLILLFSACSKSGDSNNDSGNSWTFKGTNYKAGNVVYINGGGASNLSASATGATSTSADGLVFSFATPPTSNGQMLITNTIDPNTVLVSASNLTGTTTTFYLSDVTTVNATVTVNGGKVSASFPGSIWFIT